MAVGKYDFCVDQGASFLTTFVWKLQPPDDEQIPSPNATPVDLTGHTLRMQIRPSPGSATLYFEATSANGLLALVSPEVGMFALSIPAVTSSAWTWRRGVYDMEITNPDTGAITRLLEGAVTVSPEVTV